MPGCDDAIGVLGVHCQHLVHARQVDAHAAERRADVAFERCARAERDDRDAQLVAQSRRISLTSAVLCGQITASGGIALAIRLAACRAARAPTAPRSGACRSALSVCDGTLDRDPAASSR